MIASGTLPKTHHDDDVDRKYEDALPPTEDTDKKLIVELIHECECRREDRDGADQLHIEEIIL